VAPAPQGNRVRLSAGPAGPPAGHGGDGPGL